jgi:hypothetical protein
VTAHPVGFMIRVAASGLAVDSAAFNDVSVLTGQGNLDLSLGIYVSV